MIKDEDLKKSFIKTCKSTISSSKNDDVMLLFN